MSVQQAEHEFSRTVAIDDVDGDGVRLEMEATAEEREAMARRFALRSLDRLTATAHLQRTGAGAAVRARVNFTADVVQSCVVTLDPVPDHIEEFLEFVYAPEEELLVEGGEVVLSLDDEDPPEPVRDGVIDLGEAVAERLALALEPYPRKPGASLEEVLGTAAGREDEEKESPFVVLRRSR